MDARARISALLEGARRVADATHLLGQRLRSQLLLSTGLSAQGIEAALQRCLEINPTDAEIAALLRNAASAPRAHVLLSANAFTAAHRAIAIALASSAHVFVRPSRREPHFARLLAEAAPNLFAVVDELKPEVGDTLWAYGSDVTMAELQASTVSGVNLKCHGDGFGVVVVDQVEMENVPPQAWASFAHGVTFDATLFEGRGCLGPRLVLVRGDEAFGRRVQAELLSGFSELERQIPRGLLALEEQAEITWYRECTRSVGDWRETSGGAVTLVSNLLEPVPPPGRVLQVCLVPSVDQALAQLQPLLTCIAHLAHSESAQSLEGAALRARHCRVGEMQRPPFDGPVDLRPVGVTR